MSRRLSQLDPRAAGALVGGAVFALYLATLSHWYSADSLLFAVDVDAADWHRRVDPNHLLLHPLCWLWVKAWLLAGWSGKSIVPLQVLNAAGGAMAVGLVYVLVAEAGGSRLAALLAAAAFAVSGGMWMYGTEGEDVAMALPVYAALGTSLLRCERGEARPGRAFELGLVIGLASLLYLTLAFLLVPAMVVLLEARRCRAGRAALLWLGFFAVTVPAALFVVQVRAALDDLRLVLALQGASGRYGSISWESLPRGVYAFVRTLFVFPGLGINDSTTTLWARAGTGERAALVATYVVVAAIAAVPIALALRRWREWDRVLRRRALAWVAPFVAFAFFWVPSDQEFWLPVSLAWFVLVGLLLARGAIARPAAVLLPVLLFAGNALCVILPHHDASRNALYGATVSLAARSSNADVFVTSPPQRLYLSYFGERRAIAVEEGGDVDAAVALARERAGATGGRVFVFAVPFAAASRERWRATASLDVGGATLWEVP